MGGGRDPDRPQPGQLQLTTPCRSKEVQSSQHEVGQTEIREDGRGMSHGNGPFLRRIQSARGPKTARQTLDFPSERSGEGRREEGA
jgi:hypothetical protein